MKFFILFFRLHKSGQKNVRFEFYTERTQFVFDFDRDAVDEILFLEQ